MHFTYMERVSWVKIHLLHMHSASYPSNAEATFTQSAMMQRFFLNPVMLHGIHWKALAEYGQMSIQVPGF